jgi:hypothetical protein
VSTQNEPNRLLAAVMAEAGISNKGLAARVRAQGERDGYSISADHVSVRRWLDGSMPRKRTAQYIALALSAKLGRKVTLTDLGLAADTGGGTLLEAANGEDCDPIEVSQRVWRDVRRYLIQHGTALVSRAAELYEPSWRLPHAPLLSQPSWLPEKPTALENVELEWEPSPPKPIITGQEPEVRRLLPLRTPLQTFPSYSSAIRYVSSPSLFENRPCYRLLGASLNSCTAARLRFGQSCYFDKIDVGEALAHELSSALISGEPSWSELPFRSLISDPFDLALRAANTSINTLTIRHDRATGRASFFLLRRDPARVVTGGGEYSLVPAGEFQPASVSPDSLVADLSIFRNIVREYSEELLGNPEHDGSSGRPVNYERWPFFRAMERSRERGELRLYVLGVALNALSLNATIITAAVIESSVFDSLFRDLAQLNAEGEVVACLGDGKERRGVEFDEATINHLLHVKQQVSPNAMVGLSLAWRHRDALLAG